MYGGTISKNEATKNGGGVYITSSKGHFIKTGGVIYGSDEATNKNEVKNSTALTKGHAVYYSDTRFKDNTLSNDATGNISYP